MPSLKIFTRSSAVTMTNLGCGEYIGRQKPGVDAPTFSLRGARQPVRHTPTCLAAVKVDVAAVPRIDLCWRRIGRDRDFVRVAIVPDDAVASA